MKQERTGKMKRRGREMKIKTAGDRGLKSLPPLSQKHQCRKESEKIREREKKRRRRKVEKEQEMREGFLGRKKI